jgi:hypothetical protein
MVVVDLHKMRPYWKPLGIVGTAVLLSIEPNQAFAAGYVPGTIRAKAEPIINLMKEAAEPISYGCFIWGFIKYMLGHKADAKETWKGSAYGLVGIKLLPWFFDILNSVGV